MEAPLFYPHISIHLEGPAGQRNHEIAIPGENIINEDVLNNDVGNRYYFCYSV